MKFCSINVNIFLARFVYCSMEKVFRVWRNFYIIVLYHIGWFYIKQLGNVFGIYVSIILKEDLLYTNVSIMNNEVFHFHFFHSKIIVLGRKHYTKTFLFQMNGWWFLSNTNWWHHVMIVWSLIYRNIYRREVPFLVG